MHGNMCATIQTDMRTGLKLKKYPRSVITEKTKGEKWGKGKLVTFSVSQVYNGGITIDGEWYNGVSVPPPKIPKGYKLIGIGIGYQLNCVPPYATQLLQKI